MLKAWAKRNVDLNQTTVMGMATPMICSMIQAAGMGIALAAKPIVRERPISDSQTQFNGSLIIEKNREK